MSPIVSLGFIHSKRSFDIFWSFPGASPMTPTIFEESVFPNRNPEIPTSGDRTHETQQPTNGTSAFAKSLGVGGWVLGVDHDTSHCSPLLKSGLWFQVIIFWWMLQRIEKMQRQCKILLCRYQLLRLETNMYISIYIYIQIKYTHQSIFANDDSPILAPFFLGMIWDQVCTCIIHVMCHEHRYTMPYYCGNVPIHVPVYQNPCHVFCLDRS